MRVLCTGQTGLEKAKCIEAAKTEAHQLGREVRVFHIGQMMYQEQPALLEGRILQLDIEHLRTLRKLACQKVLCSVKMSEDIIVNSHATFRWKRGLFPAFDFEWLHDFGADMYVVIIDDVEKVKLRLSRKTDPYLQGLTLKDILVWREEEVLATELMSRIPAKEASFYLVPHSEASGLICKLMFKPELKKAYLSFPISHIRDEPDLMCQVEEFKAMIKQRLVAFDPYTLREKMLDVGARIAKDQRREWVEIQTLGEQQKLHVTDIEPIVGDIDGQIIARDFKLIDQSDMIIAFVPDLQGQPQISPGVVRELHYAHSTTKIAYVIWTSPQTPSPWLTDLVPRENFFDSIAKAADHFKSASATNP